MIKLGVIGISKGNGHPYSWSAICNGYNPEHMSSCGFPDICDYLAKRSWPHDRLNDVSVTHVWCDQREQADHIAKAANIPHVVEQSTDMIGVVDGILLARDDAKSHYRIARPFLLAGLPIFIDKPLALSRDEAKRILDLRQWPGQVFSCSAMRYAPDMQLNPSKARELGSIHFIDGVASKSWNKYAVHLLDAILQIYKSNDLIRCIQRSSEEGIVSATYAFSCTDKNKKIFRVTTLGDAHSPIELSISGSGGSCRLTHLDSFTAFRKSLEQFVVNTCCRKIAISDNEMLRIVDLIEYGTRFE